MSWTGALVNFCMAFNAYGPCTDSCGYIAKVHYPPVVGAAPQMLGGRPAWVWHHSDHSSEVLVTALASIARAGKWDLSIRHDWLPDLAVYQAMSKRLPAWVYLYLAPGDSVSLGNGKGFLKAPLVLSKGEILPLVSPGAK